MMKTVDAASSAVTGSFGVIATIVAVERSVVHSDIQNSLFHSVRPCRRTAKLLTFRHFSGRLADEQLQFPVIFPVSREFARFWARTSGA
jgi:hypothetical protein